MGRAQRRAFPQVMSPNLDYPPQRSRSYTPPRRGYGQDNPYPQQQQQQQQQYRPPMEHVGRAIHMVGQFIQVRHGDAETTAARITYELEKSTQATVREARYRAEYEQAEQQLAAELSMQAAQNLQYLEAEQRIYAQARVQTVEAGLAMEYAQTQSCPLKAGAGSQRTTCSCRGSIPSLYPQFSRQIAAQTLQSDQLRRELANAQQEVEANNGKIALVEETLAQERGLSTHNLQLQAEKWEEHASTITLQAEEAIADLQDEKGEALEEIDHLSVPYPHNH